MGIYEATFILDNREVKKGWGRTKAQVTGIIEKHGAKVLSARKWDDRKLAYPIKKQKRGTYLLSYIEADGPALVSMRNELQLTDFVLRHLFLVAESVPTDEMDATTREEEEIKNEVVAEEATEDEGVVASVGQRTAVKASSEDDDSDADEGADDTAEGDSSGDDEEQDA